MDDLGTSMMISDPIPNGSLNYLGPIGFPLSLGDNVVGGIIAGLGRGGKFIEKAFTKLAEGAAEAVPYTKSTMKLGQEMHKAYKADLVDGITKFKEYTLPSGKRIDFIDFETKTIHELKPYNPRAMKAGEKQLEQYLQEIQEKFGDGWKTQLDTY